MAVRAIETRYKGYRFRSRLEARWAVFLDAVGLEWEYEVQGFDLGVDGGWYLPDFWLPDGPTWIEIKPRPDISEQAAGKARALAELSGQQTLLLAGNPWPGEFEGHLFRPRIVPYVSKNLWTCRDCGGLFVFGRLGPDGRGCFAPRVGGNNKEMACADGTGWHWFLDPEQAFGAARGARFEHGEHGQWGPVATGPDGLARQAWQRGPQP